VTTLVKPFQGLTWVASRPPRVALRLPWALLSNPFGVKTTRVFCRAGRECFRVVQMQRIPSHPKRLPTSFCRKVTSVKFSQVGSSPGGAKVNSQGRKPLVNGTTSIFLAPEGRNSTAVGGCVAPPGLIRQLAHSPRGSRPWLFTFAPPGLNRLGKTIRTDLFYRALPTPFSGS
jgi:hypothetical protein